MKNYFRHFKLWIASFTSNIYGLIGVNIVTILAFVFPIFFLINVAGILDNPYFSAFTYLVLPFVFIFGLVLLTISYFKVKSEVYKQRKKLPVFDFNNPNHRLRLTIFLIFTVINVSIVGIGAISGLNYMNSVPFCGQTCHTVMEPEYTTYLDSPHSRVKCVECHIGGGASWFVKSKLSGLRQVWAVTLGNYSKPVPSPVEDLRPARDTCEQCHWPQKFHGEKLKVKERFLPDEENTPMYTIFSLKIGGKEIGSDKHTGIHWHVDSDIIINYKALDRKREKIGWVQMEKDGEKHIYTSSAYNELSPEEQDALSIRRMDCVDCHSRPTHQFKDPYEAMDYALSHDLINSDIPWIKKVAIDILEAEYQDMQAELPQSLFQTYKSEYPEVWDQYQDDIEKAANQLIAIHKKNIFPKMDITWNTYNNHIGHKNDLGCFRCHYGDHEEEKSGSLIQDDCETCHRILLEESTDKEMVENFIFN